ncbi:UNVERIFIED_ORG: hypothetical protein ABIC62_006437 [Burkholderia sp. 1595]|uniref:Uncharacterized protein n=1 Tax=Paraburkholderia terricola TaxID=169427 RepID=A0ABU1M238_9BURK|nr:hypothetical protein [Paraburkholderia terricola]MDR6412982.1 hypothetical protein [Paraburkholderia terricola]
MLAEAGRFSEARDQLPGEISLRQYDGDDNDNDNDADCRMIGRFEHRLDAVHALWQHCREAGTTLALLSAQPTE